MEQRLEESGVFGTEGARRPSEVPNTPVALAGAVFGATAGRAARFVRIRTPKPDEPVTRETFACRFDRAAWRRAQERDGRYILRARIPWEDWPTEAQRQAPALWAWYMQLVQVEEAFRTLKSDLGLRPIFHQVEPRVEAHILVAFLGYCLSVTLRAKLRKSAPGLTHFRQLPAVFRGRTGRTGVKTRMEAHPAGRCSA